MSPRAGNTSPAPGCCFQGLGAAPGTTGRSPVPFRSSLLLFQLFPCHLPGSPSFLFIKRNKSDLSNLHWHCWSRRGTQRRLNSFWRKYPNGDEEETYTENSWEAGFCWEGHYLPYHILSTKDPEMEVLTPLIGVPCCKMDRLSLE